MTGQPPTDRLTKRMYRYTSIDRLMLSRNLSYGVALTQVGVKDIGLEVSVISSSVALPIGLLIGGVYESYIFFGRQSYAHLRTGFSACLY
jgi:hypothetical protein